MSIILDGVDYIKNATTTLDVNNPPQGGSESFVATGNIGAGQTVGLRSDGTVEVIADITTNHTTSAGTPAVFGSVNTSYVSATFDTNTNKVVIAYRDNVNSDYGTAVVGTVSGTSISFGSPAVFNNNGSTTYISAAFDSNSDKVVIAYRDDGNSGYGTAVVGTVSGTSISFGSPTVFESGNTNYTSVTFDPNTNKVVIAYKDLGNSGYPGTAVVGTVSGTSISFGNPVVFHSGNTNYTSTIFDSNSNKVVIAYSDNSDSNYGKAVVGTVSETSITFGSPVIFEYAHTEYCSATFDSNSNKVVIAYTDCGNSLYGTAVVGTVSGNSISFGTPKVFESAYTNWISATFDSNTNKVVIAYQDNDNSNYGTAIVGTVSGNSISFGTPVVFDNAATYYMSATFDSNTNKVVITYIDNGNSNYGTATVFQAEGTGITTNADTWLGIAEEAITSGDSGKVNLVGSVVSNQTGLTAGDTYYVNYDGNLTDTANEGKLTGTYGKIGKALSSTSLLLSK